MAAEDYTDRVRAERIGWAERDPEGEAEAVVPIRPMTAEDWDRVIPETPIRPSERPWPAPASTKDPESALADNWLVEGCLRPGRLMVIAGQEGVGKSHARAELGIRIATGHGELFDHYVIPAKARVLLVEVENGDEEETRREEEIVERFGLRRSDFR